MNEGVIWMHEDDRKFFKKIKKGHGEFVWGDDPRGTVASN
jgi:hypothetical protein